MRFWEGRFRSQALLDEAAVLTAMAYVDLNPIRAKVAPTPETSEYTSVAERIAGLKTERGASASESGAPQATTAPASPGIKGQEEPAQLLPESLLSRLVRAPLMPFDATGRMVTAIPFAFEDYLDLVDDTGRVIREDKRGYIDGRTPPLLERLNIDPEQFIVTNRSLMRQFGSAIGTPEHLTERCVARQTKFLRGIRSARGLFERKAA